MTVDRVERTWAPGVVRSLAGALLLLVGGCAPSAESLEEKVKDEPGVITVEVMEGGGDDDLPFTRIPKSAWVLKEPDASADEVMPVFDKYDDDIDDDVDDDVDLVQVRLQGPKKSTLLDRYRDDKDIVFVQIESGQFLLIRDSVNEDLARTFARERFVLLVDQRFRLKRSDPPDAAVACRCASTQGGKCGHIVGTSYGTAPMTAGTYDVARDVIRPSGDRSADV